MGDHGEEDEVYLGDGQGGIDGVVVADLEGQDDVEIGGEDEMEEDAGSIDDAEGVETMDDVQDDSIHSFEGHKGSVFGVAWSRKGDSIVCSGGEDDMAACWKVATDVNNVEGLETSWLRGHTDSVIQASYSGDGELLATAGMEGVVKIWKHPGYELLHTLDGPGEAIEWIDWHPKGDVVLAGSADFTAWMWNARTGACMQVFSGHKSPVTCGGFTPDGKLAVCGGGDLDPSLRVFDPKNGSCLHSIEGHGFHESGLTCIDFSADSTITVTGSSDNTGKIASLHTGKAVGTLQGHTDSVECCCFVEGSLPLVLTGSLDGNVLIWDQGSLAKRQNLTHPQGVTVMKTIPSTALLTTGSIDGVVRVWDMRSSDCIKEFHGFRANVLCLDISPDSKYIIAGSDDGTVRAFEL